MITVLEVVRKSTEFLAGKGVESARLNAELLIGHALGLKRMQLYLQFERPLTEAELESIRPLIRRRAQHEPLQYIVGETEFHGLKLKVDKRALIPRPETEQLVALVIAKLPAPPTRILDLGTGTGAIALALARAFPAADVVAVDCSPDALALAAENATQTELAERVRWLTSDWFAAVPPGAYDLIVSNPPYLTSEETAAAALEVRGFEPTSALTSGDEGAADLLAIIAGAAGFLTRPGLLALETGVAQHPRLLAALSAAGFARSESHQDMAGRDRFVLGWRE